MPVDYAALKKGGFMRQKQKNCFSLRLRVVGGNVTVKQLSAIARVAEKYGDGHVHLTSRQSIEIPFVHLEDIDAVKAELSTGDVEPGVCGPRVIDAAIAFFDENAKSGERFKFTIDRFGWEKFREKMLEAVSSG